MSLSIEQIIERTIQCKQKASIEQKVVCQINMQINDIKEKINF